MNLKDRFLVYGRSHARVRRLFVFVAASIFAVGGVIVGAGQASADVVVGPTQYQNKAGGLCLDDYGASTANYNMVDVWTCNGSNAQQWYYDLSYDSLYVNINGTIKCLDVRNSGSAPGTRVDIYQCNGTSAQIWYQTQNGNWVNPIANLCLDDPSGSDQAGMYVQVWTCNGETPQVWL